MKFFSNRHNNIIGNIIVLLILLVYLFPNHSYAYNIAYTVTGINDSPWNLSCNSFGAGGGSKILASGRGAQHVVCQPFVSPDHGPSSVLDLFDTLAPYVSRSFDLINAETGQTILTNTILPAGTKITASNPGAIANMEVAFSYTYTGPKGKTGYLVEGFNINTNTSNKKISILELGIPMGNKVITSEYVLSFIGTAHINYTLTSSNPDIISCSNNICTLRDKSGLASITASFDTGGLRLDKKFASPGNFGTYSWTVDYDYSPIDADKQKSYNITVNKKPIVSNYRVDNISYTDARGFWEYSDPDGDSQASYEIQVYEDKNFTTKLKTYTKNTNEIQGNINNLKSGQTLWSRVRVKDSRGAWSDWSNTVQFTPKAYPVPDVYFRLSGGGNTAKNGGTLTVKTGDVINLNWEVKDPDGTTPPSGLNSCSITTTGGAGENLFSSNNFNGSNSTTGPTNINDLIYQINLNCIGKEAETVRNIAQSINLKVLSYPLVSCNLLDGRRAVSADNKTINIGVTVDNLSGNYNWEVKRDDGDSQLYQSGSSSPIPNPLTLDYSGLGFGQYQPWVKVSRLNNDNISRDTTCNTITNFGKSTIREINP